MPKATQSPVGIRKPLPRIATAPRAPKQSLNFRDTHVGPPPFAKKRKPVPMRKTGFATTLKPKYQRKPSIELEEDWDNTMTDIDMAATADNPGLATLSSAVPEENDMEQARLYVCKQCGTGVLAGHRFCGSCGAPVPEVVQEGRTDYFGWMQEPGQARLVLVHGQGQKSGANYMLKGNEHTIGRHQTEICFPDDELLDDTHANFICQDGELTVRDESSLNGIYIRIHEDMMLEDGMQFICGEQMFRVERCAAAGASMLPGDDTRAYASPHKPSEFRIVQVLTGGTDGMVCHAIDGQVSIGREQCAMNFPEDAFMSSEHARLELASTGIRLADLSSKNGTYIRVDGQKALRHGDYLFIGKQLLRVEISS